MKVLIAADKFKGSLTAEEVCEAIRDGLRSGTRQDLEIRCLPLSDGGEGLARALTRAHGGGWKTLEVENAQGDPTRAGYGFSPDEETAYLEMAEASGLEQLAGKPLDPWTASTYGTGQLLRDAMDAGARHLILGIGGSATNDGGSGMAAALGFRFLDDAGRPVREIPARLDEVASIEDPEKPLEARVTVACDVVNPLLGPDGATRVYGPQKGIPASGFDRHEARLSHLCKLLGPGGRAAAREPGAGAAGGLGFGCRAFLDATLTSGFDLVAESLQLEEAVRWADLVLTGEGRIDPQSLEGKAPFGVAKAARQAGKRIAAFCGACEIPIGEEQRFAECFGSLHEVGKRQLSLAENLARGGKHLREAACAFAGSW